MTVLVDSHAHLADPKFAGDLDAVLRRAREAGVRAILAVGADLETSRQVVELAARYPDVWAAVGIHPNDADRATSEALRELHEVARRPKVVAIGETGLDYYWKRVSADVQKRVLEAHLALAEELGLPVVLHNREAGEDLLSLVGAWGAQQRVKRDRPAGVFHSFSGDAAFLARVVAAGFVVSFAGQLTYRSASAVREAARVAPADMLLVETDSPYLAPADDRGKRASRNEPAAVARVASVLAGIRGETDSAIARATSDVARELFGISIRDIASDIHA